VSGFVTFVLNPKVATPIFFKKIGVH
jgi:hypothetical protein